MQAEQDVERLGAAITAIEAIGAKAGWAPRPARAPAVRRRRRRGRMSAAARRKLSRLLKQRWAAGKMRRRAKKKA